MKRKYKVINGKRVPVCSYKNCRKLANPNYSVRSCDNHIQAVLRVTPVAMEPTWFSRLIEEVAEFIRWMFRR